MVKGNLLDFVGGAGFIVVGCVYMGILIWKLCALKDSKSFISFIVTHYLWNVLCVSMRWVRLLLPKDEYMYVNAKWSIRSLYQKRRKEEKKINYLSFSACEYLLQWSCIRRRKKMEWFTYITHHMIAIERGSWEFSKMDYSMLTFFSK